MLKSLNEKADVWSCSAGRKKLANLTESVNIDLVCFTRDIRDRADLMKIAEIYNQSQEETNEFSKAHSLIKSAIWNKPVQCHDEQFNEHLKDIGDIALKYAKDITQSTT